MARRGRLAFAARRTGGRARGDMTAGRLAGRLSGPGAGRIRWWFGESGAGETVVIGIDCATQTTRGRGGHRPRVRGESEDAAAPHGRRVCPGAAIEASPGADGTRPSGRPVGKAGSGFASWLPALGSAVGGWPESPAVLRDPAGPRLRATVVGRWVAAGEVGEAGEFCGASGEAVRPLHLDTAVRARRRFDAAFGSERSPPGIGDDG